MKRRPFPTYDQAARAAQALGIQTAREYSARYRETPGLPSSPYKTYALAWRGWSTFLNTTPKPMPVQSHASTLPLDEARGAARAAGLTTITRYRRGHAQVPGLPRNPDAFYAQWPGWPTFLGEGKERPDPFATLEEFTTAVRELGITTRAAYRERYRERPNLPRAPNQQYPDWPGWPAALGTARSHRARPAAPRLDYGEAAAYARAVGWRRVRQYREGCRLHPGLPRRPELFYRQQWRGWPVFLGTASSTQSRRARRFTLPLGEAAAATAAAGISSRAEYLRRYREVPGLTSNPDQHYPDWPGWPAFLGRAKRAGPFLNLPEWVAAVNAMGITTATQYAQRYQERPDLPSNPYREYPDFPGWRAALEKWEEPSRLRHDEVLPYEEARRVVRAAGFRTFRGYLARRRDYPGLPFRPSATYAGQWPGWKVFAGTE